MGLFCRRKNTDKPIIRQIIDLIPKYILAESVSKYNSNKGCHKYLTYDQLVALTFGQLNKCLTLNDISTGIGVTEGLIKDLGLKQSPARSTMSDGNTKRDYRVFEHLYLKLLSHYKGLLMKKHLSHQIKEILNRRIKLIDSTTISLCLSLFDWAKFRTAKGGLKIHTSWDDAIQIPDMVNITEAKTHDRHGMKSLIYPKDTIVVEDRGYFDFELMMQRIEAENVFVTRIKTNTVYDSVEELNLSDETDQDILKDEIIQLTGNKAQKIGISSQKLRLVTVYKENARTGESKAISIISNQITWSARTIADLYKRRWDIELFFKGIKQNLQVKTFLGTSENTVKSQIYVALICYLLLELINRNTNKKNTAFSNFVEKIRLCLFVYQTLNYVCNEVSSGAKRVKSKRKPPPQPELFQGK